MRVWRLCRAARVEQAFTGEGARLYGGRCNPKGVAVVYTSATLSLAILEALVHTEVSTLPDDYCALAAEIPDELPVNESAVSELPNGWRDPHDHQSLQAMGHSWLGAGETAVLSVPSAVVPEEHNCLINPAHRDTKKIKVGAPQPFSIDPRTLSATR